MLVEEIMKTEVITLPPTATIQQALDLLNQHKIRHIPIIDKENHVIGIVSDRDVRDASPSIFESDEGSNNLQHEIQSIMSHPVITIHPLDFVEEIAKIFYDKEIACLPVVREGNRLVGIVTEKDMLYTMIQLTGTHVQGSHIEIKVPHRPGILPEVTAIFGKRKTNIVSVLVYPSKDDPEYKILVFRIQTMNPLPVIEDLREAGYELLAPNHTAGPLK
ncbi:MULTISPECIES: acetoin utilization AcuB family protein [Virgibacillus]|uniref:Acetoin utilization protein AcuB n=1 Tax=Virgibacillus pantothenticus TaxID=1473 RepID=A0A0L0QQD5_VIRPA|nr:MULTISPECIES: acetoin utilization AcuB family protein [Virgibacillus]API90863.1 acetoin utilization protein AcuB [Virgibacillus sp. 6R]KNE20807.1 acetoin utilization protein AcuB [Virgibacillus pantothenticus]MBS7429313.1 acetoin utilization AcuB family protein [Virgibacillus sp. 19R1-5]MBU8568905.1 acetoin utilization AcuB family protein [Virgibacillus pantothenticus]MBU8602907.1 acetoin utilization AcuB family protein [Virgibacillus pantothenticus]